MQLLNAKYAYKKAKIYKTGGHMYVQHIVANMFLLNLSLNLIPELNFAHNSKRK